MSNHALRRAFLVFHLVLGGVVFLESVRTALHASALHIPRPHATALAWFAGVEAVAAVLFLLPMTLKLGATLLLLIFGIALTLHGMQGDLESTLLVYAAGVLLVMIHGSAFRRGGPKLDTATS